MTTTTVPMPVAEALAEGAPKNLGALAGAATGRGWGAMVERNGDAWTLVITGVSRTERYTWRAGKWVSSNPRGYRAALAHYRAEADGAATVAKSSEAPVTADGGTAAMGAAVAAGKDAREALSEIGTLANRAESLAQEAAEWSTEADDAATVARVEESWAECEDVAGLIGRTEIRARKYDSEDARPASGLVKEGAALLRRVLRARRTLSDAAIAARGDDSAESVCDEWSAIVFKAEEDARECLGRIEDASDQAWESVEACESRAEAVCRKCECLIVPGVDGNGRKDMNLGSCGCRAIMAATLADGGSVHQNADDVRIGRLLASDCGWEVSAGQLALIGDESGALESLADAARYDVDTVDEGAQERRTAVAAAEQRTARERECERPAEAAAAECRAFASIADDHASRAGEAYDVTAHVARYTRSAYDMRPVDCLPDAEADTVRAALRRIDRRAIRANACASRARYDAWCNPQDDPEYARQCAERARILADAAERDARRAGELFAYAEYATEAELWAEREADRERERAEAARIDGGYALGEPRKVEGDARATLPVGSLVNVPGRGSWVRVVRVRLDGSGACVVDGTEVIGDVPGRGHARVPVDYSTPDSGAWVVAQVAGEGAPVRARTAVDAAQGGPTGETAPEGDQRAEEPQSRELDADTSKNDSAPGGEGGFSRELDAYASKERPAVLPDVVSDPGGVDGWETDGGAVEVLPVICHGKGGGVFPVAFRGPYEGTVRVSRAWLTERARRALTVARERLTVAEEYAETCAAWRRDAYDLHQEVRRSAGVLGERVAVHYETSGGWSERAREASWAADRRRMDARAAVRRCERELSGLEEEATEPGRRSQSARAFLARAVSGDVPAGRGAWVSADGGTAVMFELPADAGVNPDMELAPGMAERRAFVDLLADAVSARDEGRALIGRDLPSKKTHGRTGGIEKGQASASVKALVQLWKAPKIPAAGKAPTAAQLEDWQDGYAGAPVVAETEAAPGVWLPMAAVAFAETATANGWTVAMQRQGATVTVRAGGRATGKVPGEVRAVWSAGLYDVTASGAWVDGVRLDIVATLHAVNATISQECKAPGVLAEDARPDAHADAVDLDGWEGEGGALAREGGELPPPAPRDEMSARAADVVSDPSGVDVWEAEGGAVPGVAVPRGVAQFRELDANTSKSDSTPGGEGGLSRELDACASNMTPGEEAEAADIVIRHTHEDGTTVEGSARGDGVWEALRSLGWTYRRTPGIFIRGSRYKGADRWKINRAADAVRALGLSCAVVIEETMSFAEREAARVDAAEDRAQRYADRAGRAAASSQSARDTSDRIGERFWMGQPILVGHHSEGRARRDQERMHNAMRKSIAEGERAGYWASRAAAADAYERYRKNPGRTLRRIEKLEAERRGVLRERDGVDDKGRTADVWRREPSEARREELTRRLAEYDEELTYWAETIKEAERRGFKVWGRADFLKGDFVRWRGSWYEVTRVNAKTVTVPHIHAAYDGGAVGAVGGCRVVTRAATAETRHKGSTYTLPYDEVSGRMSAEQMRAALAGEEIPADPRDVTPEPAPEAAEAERAAEHQDQAAPAPVAPAAMVSAPAPAGVSDPGTAAAWEGDGGAVPGVAAPRPVAQFRELDANASNEGAAPGGVGGFSRELDANASTNAAGSAAEGAPVAPVPQDGAALRDALIAAHGNEDAMRAADWWCDSHCVTCADGRECADCETCTAFAAPWPARWARRRVAGAPERQVHICHGPGGMSEGQRLALGGDDSADVDAVGIEIEADAAATARAAGYTIIHADVRTVDPRHPVLMTVERLHFSTPCPTISRGGKGSGVKPAEVERFMDVMFHAAEWLGHIEVEDVCQDYGGPHDYEPQQEGDKYREAAWDPDAYEGSWQMVCGTHDEDTDECGDDCTQWIETQHCMSGRAAAAGTPDEFRAAALEACADQRTALMAEVLLWPMVMIKGGGALQSVTMEQSDNLMKSAAPLCAAIETELRESLEFDWVSFQVECASRYGAASRRSRTWMVAVRDGEPAGAVCTADRDEVRAYEAGLWGGRKDKIPANRPDMAYRVDFLGGRQPLPALTVAQALGWDSGLVVDTRGVRGIDPKTGRPKGGGSFSADVVSQCVTATWYGATLRRADEPQGCASLGKAFTQQQLALLVGFRWDYPWQHVGRGVGIRNMAQMAADAVSPFMGMAVTGATVKRARRVWYRRALAYQRALYAFAEQLWTDEQRALVADHVRSGDVQAQAGAHGFPRVQVPPMLPAPPVRLMLERGPVRLELPPGSQVLADTRVTLDGRAHGAAARPSARRAPVAAPVRGMLAAAPGAGGAAPREPHSAAAAAPVGGPLSGPAEARGNRGVPAGHSTRQGATRQGTRQGTRQPSGGAERALPTGGLGRTLPRSGGRAPPSSARPRAGRDRRRHFPRT
ncbi:DUF3560 domain-containing protein [Streptomyces marianii]|uniref:DUF3560 domain-containing protein n=1 Tax=Streptomyces marianii TaxID=1817406 RepID=A0A5R9DT38_9ACTN|nr:DUF3560 domain-containing protein [Streptomyces marianii]TLQ38825.1 DUF3560 domain-containing protein [Streptomyces marianii]